MGTVFLILFIEVHIFRLHHKAVCCHDDSWSVLFTFLGLGYLYEGESVIIRNAVTFVFLLAALSFSRVSLDVVFFLSQLCRFEVARSVPLSQP